MTSYTRALRAQLPSPQRLIPIAVGAGDLLIHAPGFEDRTMAVADSVVVSHGFTCVLLDYRPFSPKNRLPAVKTRLIELGATIGDNDILTYDRFDPADFESRLRDRLRILAPQRVIVDISTMSKLAILLTLNVCYTCDSSVTIVYSEAEHYGPSQEEFETARRNDEIHQPTLQIFTGVHGVVRVSSLGSVAMQGQPTAALVFMSFNDALTQVLLNTVYPTRLFLINGRPPVHSWREHATAWIHDQVRREWEEDNPISQTSGLDTPLPLRVVSTLDYRETVAMLINLYWELSATHRVLLAPAGSKMQAVGCWVTKALHPDVHIEYPSPEGFTPEYSGGVSHQWSIDLGRLSNLVESVGAEERRSFLELAVQ